MLKRDSSAIPGKMVQPAETLIPIKWHYSRHYERRDVRGAENWFEIFFYTNYLAIAPMDTADRFYAMEHTTHFALKVFFFRFDPLSRLRSPKQITDHMD